MVALIHRVDLLMCEASIKTSFDLHISLLEYVGCEDDMKKYLKSIAPVIYNYKWILPNFVKVSITNITTLSF